MQLSIRNTNWYLILPLLLLSCINESTEPLESLGDNEITWAEARLVPDRESKEISAVLKFSNWEAVDYLLVRKSGGNSYSQKIERKELSPVYDFKYTVQPDDPESFKLVLTVWDKKGKSSKELSLTIDNRWGFFIRKTERIARVSGKPMAGESFPSPNNTVSDWHVGGTDLGIIWEMNPGRYGIFFGDTYGFDFVPNTNNPGPNGGNWRSNVLAFSDDLNVDDGLYLSDMVKDNNGHAKEIIQGGKNQSGNGDWTSIPSAAIRANGIDYVHFFNMKNWTGWITNYSGLSKSVDNGQTWTPCENVRFAPHSNFAQAGYFKKEGYVYMIGTKPGRRSAAHLCRFREADIENRGEYEYWNGVSRRWEKGDETQATVLIDDAVAELSFIYNHTHKKWIIAYFNETRYHITMRVAEEITGPWSEPFELASGKEYPQLYGSFFHPLSATGDNLYFTMSMWLPYNVFLMKTTLADMGNF